MCLLCTGQTINLSDSLRHVLSYQPIPTIKLDTRNSFITGRNARVMGIKAGVTFRKTLTLGIGYNWMATELPEIIEVDELQRVASIRMRYVAPFIEYSFYKKGHWEASVPVQLGFGKSFLSYKDVADRQKIYVDNIVLYEPLMTLEYKIMNLLGVGAGVGYRIMLRNNEFIDEQFTSPVYTIRIRLIFEEVYKLWEKHNAEEKNERNQ